MREWDVICFLTEQTLIETKAWGLRLGYTREDARKQMREGFHGDALAVGCAYRLLDGVKSGKVTAAWARAQIRGSEMSYEDKAELIRRFRTCVKIFLRWGIGRIINADKHYNNFGRLHECLCAIIHEDYGVAFFIPVYNVVDAEADEPYTGKNGEYGLGKYGKKTVEKASILKDLITFSNQEVGEALDLKAQGRHGMDVWNQSAFEFVVDRLADLAYRKLVAIAEQYAPEVLDDVESRLLALLI